MGDERFYNVYLSPKEGVSTAQIKKKMSLSIDWFHYAKFNWVLYSNSSMDKWMTRLKPLVGKSGLLFISEFDPDDIDGWMPQEFWDWLED